MADAKHPVRNERWDLERFFQVRRNEVLSQWPVEVDLDEAVAYHRSLPPSKLAHNVLDQAEADRRVIVQHRHGLCLIDDNIRDLQYLEDVGGTDISSTQSDAYTRQGQLHKAQQALEESRRLGRSLTVGIPAHCYGVHGVRRIVDALRRPLSIRMASADSRLSKEIYLAAGFTYALMGTLQNLSYEKDAPVDQMIEHYQYEDRLIAWYEEQGVPIVKEATATLTGTLCPPALIIACSIIDAILEATQGVRRIALSYGIGGNLFQDVAAIRVLRQMGREWLDSFGFHDVALYVVTSQWMADFPQDVDQAYSVITYSTAAAALGRTTMIMTKSLHEAFGVPTKEANASGLRATRQMLRILEGQELTGGQVDVEAEVIREEAACILKKAFELGEGDAAQAAVRAVATGVIDVPFSPSRHNAGKVLPVKDISGALRYADPGNLPLSPAILNYHRDRLRERYAKEPGRKPYELMIDDIFSMSRPLEDPPLVEQPVCV